MTGISGTELHVVLIRSCHLRCSDNDSKDAAHSPSIATSAETATTTAATTCTHSASAKKLYCDGSQRRLVRQ